MVIDRIPGTEYLYSNAGYSILQQLAVDVEEKSFPEIVRERIFQPLEMDNTTFQQPLPEYLFFPFQDHRSSPEYFPEFLSVFP